MNFKAIAGYSAGTVLAFTVLNLIFIGMGAAWLGVVLVGAGLGLGAGVAVHQGYNSNPVLGGATIMGTIWLAFTAVVFITGHAHGLNLAYFVQGLVSMGLVGVVGGLGYKLFSN